MMDLDLQVNDDDRKGRKRAAINAVPSFFDRTAPVDATNAIKIFDYLPSLE